MGQHFKNVTIFFPKAHPHLHGSIRNRGNRSIDIHVWEILPPVQMPSGP